MTVVSYSKPEYISSMDWVIPTKFRLIDFDLLKRVTSPNQKPEVVLCRILKIVKTSLLSPISVQFGTLMQDNMSITVKLEVEFQFGER